MTQYRQTIQAISSMVFILSLLNVPAAEAQTQYKQDLKLLQQLGGVVHKANHGEAVVTFADGTCVVINHQMIRTTDAEGNIYITDLRDHAVISAGPPTIFVEVQAREGSVKATNKLPNDALTASDGI